MERLTANEGQEVWLCACSPGESLRSPFAGKKFAVMVIHFGGDVSAVEKRSVARDLIAQGCRYAVCAGHESDAWENAFDEVDIELNPGHEDDRFVMTTSHGVEALDEVVWFFIRNTFAGAFEPRFFLVATLGAGPADMALLRSSLARAVG